MLVKHIIEHKTQYDKVHTHEDFKLTKPARGFKHILSHIMHGPF